MNARWQKGYTTCIQTANIEKPSPGIQIANIVMETSRLGTLPVSVVMETTSMGTLVVNVVMETGGVLTPYLLAGGGGGTMGRGFKPLPGANVAKEGSTSGIRIHHINIK